MISILHICDLPGPNPWLNGIADHHDRAQFRHVVANLNDRNKLHDTLESRGIQAFELGANSKKQHPLAALKLARLLQRERIDILQAHTFYATSVGLAAAKLARTPVSILTRHHANFTTLFKKPVHRQVDRLHALVATRVWAPSHYIKKCMVELERVPADRITVIPHAFDFELMKPRLSTDRRRALRESVGGDDKFLIGTVARLVAEKGHEYLFSAAPEIIARRSDARFVIVGDGSYRAQLERMVAEKGLTGHVHFLGWRWDAWDLIEAMDLIAHPSLHEPFGIVYVEAMALERPVVTTNDSASPEIIDHGETGRIVPPRRPDLFASAILDVMEDKEEAARMGKLARIRAIERFDYRKMIREYESWYRRWTVETKSAS